MFFFSQGGFFFSRVFFSKEGILLGFLLKFLSRKKHNFKKREDFKKKTFPNGGFWVNFFENFFFEKKVVFSEKKFFLNKKDDF